MAEVKDQDFLEYIVKTLVDHPNDVIVNRDVDEMGVLLTVKVNPEDMGQLIGRQGSTARAIRSLVKIIGLKNHARVNLKIEEPEGSTKVREERKEEKIEDVTDGLDDLKI
ncbi:MAG TPA: KH domain-containing protein [Candidatus Pacearchaeota archaeon]|nr:KH domain-containing protein [Candidatus Pacearchaeota archaeon]